MRKFILSVLAYLYPVLCFGTPPRPRFGRPSPAPVPSRCATPSKSSTPLEASERAALRACCTALACRNRATINRRKRAKSEILSALRPCGTGAPRPRRRSSTAWCRCRRRAAQCSAPNRSGGLRPTVERPGLQQWRWCGARCRSAPRAALDGSRRHLRWPKVS